MRAQISPAELQYRRDVAAAQIEDGYIEPIPLDETFDRKVAEEHRIAFEAVYSVLERHSSDPVAATILGRMARRDDGS